MFDGEAWTPEYTSGESQTVPRAARFLLAMEDASGDTHSLSTEVFIPSGSITLSPIQRVSAPAPTNAAAP